MAMTKAEKLRLETLENELREAKALRFTEPVLPDIDPPGPGFDKETNGFTIVGSGQYAQVKVGWSTSIGHGVGYASRSEQRKAGLGGSQGARHLYSTRLLALRGMRNAVEKEAAQRLARIDKMIEEEISGSGSDRS
jgi:hypothetical protein